MGSDRERSSKRRDEDYHRHRRRRSRERSDYRRSSDRGKHRRPHSPDSRDRYRRRSHRRSSSDERRHSKKEYRSKRDHSSNHSEEPKDKRQKREKMDIKEAEFEKKDFTADITPEDIELMQKMGIPFGFDTTQGKHVEDDEANVGAIRTKSLRQARQYMNRKKMERRTEFKLLECCGVKLKDTNTDALPKTLEPFLDAIEKREFDTILNDEPFAKWIDFDGSFEENRKEVENAVNRAAKNGDTEACLRILTFGVAALLTFVRHNLTGPKSSDPVNSAENEKTLRKMLEMNGEDFLPKTSRSDLLLLARWILVEPLSLTKQSTEELKSFTLQLGDLSVELESESTNLLKFFANKIPTWLWWAGRVSFIHQKFLKHNSAFLRIECAQMVETLQTKIVEIDHWPVEIRAQLCIELAQWEFLYRRIQAAQTFLSKAEQLMKVSIELSGALGKRTVHQHDPKAQLFVQIQRDSKLSEVLDQTDLSETSLQADAFMFSCSEDDVLMNPRWSEENAPVQLSSLEACLALAKCDAIELGTADDDLKLWEMEAFTQLIQSQTKTAFLIQAKAALTRIKHERRRGRTKERALQMMAQLVERITQTSTKALLHRLDYVFSIRMPTMHHLRKLLAEHHISFGIVSTAITIYEEMEMWDELVLCYRLIDKKAIADTIVCRQLETDSQNPSLLCTLADLRSDPSLWKKAWEMSQHKYPRAQRSLARHALEKKNYKSAAESFELALELNALHPDAWFSLGFCYLNLEDDANALKAFTRCTQLEPENGESWNNLAALWMRQHKMDRALWALKEAVKYKRNSWETWENYARASQECGEYNQVIQGLTQVLELTSGQRLHSDLLTSLIQSFLDLSKDVQQSTQSEKLGKRLETFLRSACLASAWKPEFWISFSKVHARLEQPVLSRECLMKCFRQLQGASWKSDNAKFVLLVSVIFELVQYHKEHPNEGNDIASLRLQLKGIVKQAERIYMDTEMFEKLQSLHSEVERVASV